MATHFTASPSSSIFLFPSKPFNPFSFFVKTPSLYLKKPPSATATATAFQSPPSLQSFWQWLTDQGAVSGKSPARPSVVPEGLGLVAQRDIGRNEVVLEIPKKLWINSDAVAASAIGNVCNGLKPWMGVALFLIREKLNENSTWRPYLDILPQTTNSTIYCAGQKKSLLS